MLLLPVLEGVPLGPMDGMTEYSRWAGNEVKGRHRTSGTELLLESQSGLQLVRARLLDLLTRGVHVIRSGVKHTR